MTVPFFSIIIPTYNRASFIGATLDSVLTQEFAAFEVLVVDDGSTDNTAAVVGEFVDPRLRYLSKQNAERGAARNYGVARARGEYVLFLDSDDLLHPNHLTTIYSGIKAERMPPNFIATRYDFLRDGRRYPSPVSGVPAGRHGLDTFIDGNVIACNFAARRQNPGLFPFEEDRRYAAVEDWLFLLQNTQHDAIILLDALTVTMNDHDTRSMRADNQGLIRRLELAGDWMQQHLRLTPEQRVRLLGRVHYLCAVHAYADGRRAQALRYTQQAWVALPLPQGVALAARSLLGIKAIERIKRLRS